MLSVMAASARKRFSATRSTAVKNMFNNGILFVGDTYSHEEKGRRYFLKLFYE